MPIFSVRRLLCVGNPVDGYDVNDTRDAGEVYIPPSGELGMQDDQRPYERAVLKALADAELIGDEAGPGELEFEGEAILVNEPVSAFVATREDSDEERFIAMCPEGSLLVPGNGPGGMVERHPPPTRRQSQRFEAARQRAAAELQGGELVDVVDGFEPYYSLDPQEIPADSEVIWKTVAHVGPKTPGTEVEKVAAAFSRLLRAQLSAADMETVVRRNEDRSIAGGCHSHDFCDANMVMSAAMQEVTGHTEYEIVDSIGREADLTDLWNSAWDLAMKQKFVVPYDLSVLIGYSVSESESQVVSEVEDRFPLPAVSPVDRFSWPLADWQRAPTFGFDPLTSEQLTPTRKQVEG